jgi:hypothetical protein
MARRRNITIGNDQLTGGSSRSYLVGDSGVFITAGIGTSLPLYTPNPVRDAALSATLSLRNKLWIQHYQKHLSAFPRNALRGTTRMPFLVNAYKFACDSLTRYEQNSTRPGTSWCWCDMRW